MRLMISTSRQTLITCVILSFVWLSACSDWPPHADALDNHFHTHQAAIESLYDTFNSSDFVAMHYGGNASPIVASRSFDEYRQRQTGAQADNFREQMEEAGIFELFRDGGNIYMETYYDVAVDNRMFRALFTRDLDPTSLIDCSTVNSEARPEQCTISLSQGWYILYVWAAE